MVKLAHIATFLTAIALAVPVPATAQVPPARPAERGAVPSEEGAWLFVVNGEISAINGDQMTIATDSHGIAFSDRPDRQVRLVHLPTFVASAWGEGGDFQSDPPNAALVDEDQREIGVIEITNATWSDNMLVLTFEMLEGEVPLAGEHIALVVDGFCWPCLMGMSG